MANTFKIGLSNVHYAVWNESTSTYDTPVPLAPAISCKMSSSNQTANAYADNRIQATAVQFDGCEVELETAKIPSDVLVDILGITKDSNGVLIYDQDQRPPYIALLFQTELDGGAKGYFTLYKGKFAMNDEEITTRGESIEFKGDTITGQFIADDNGIWKAFVRSDDSGLGVDVIANWFTEVYITS